MRSLLFLSSLLSLCWARTLLIQTEDEDKPDIRAMEHEDKEGRDKANIDDHAERRKGTNKMAGIDSDCHPWCGGPGIELAPGQCFLNRDCGGNGKCCNLIEPAADTYQEPGNCVGNETATVDPRGFVGGHGGEGYCADDV